MQRYSLQIVFSLCICVISSSARAGIAGSKHDFGRFRWSQTQICLPCHAPHNAIVRDANGQIVDAPLWNHTLSTATYTLYLDANGQGVTGQVDTNSKLCLSCHDGTIALDSFGGATGNQEMTAGVFGTDLSHEHPIGEAALWPTPNPSYLVDPSLRTAQNIMPLRKLSDGRLVVGCTSCHEPHNRANQLHMTWVNNIGPATTVDGRAVTGSLLCMNCHKK
ncbi:MAG TPA: hypothetical protein VHD56_08175 [Tepidisphaeraceae bacterium]|nr:hypothetical protein [Tepidisphaeraceae bacterium]